MKETKQCEVRWTEKRLSQSITVVCGHDLPCPMHPIQNFTDKDYEGPYEAEVIKAFRDRFTIGGNGGNTWNWAGQYPDNVGMFIRDILRKYCE